MVTDDDYNNNPAPDEHQDGGGEPQGDSQNEGNQGFQLERDEELGGIPLPEGWRDKIDDNLKDSETIKTTKTLDELVAKAHTAEKFGDGENTIKLPESEEEKFEVFNKLGRPEEPDQYEFDKPEQLEEKGLKWDEEKEKQWKEFFHKQGLTNEQAKNLTKAFNESIINNVEQESQQSQQKKKELADEMKKEFGNEYEQVLQTADKMADEYRVKDVLQDAGVYDHPLVQNLLYAAADATEEDSGFSGGTSSDKANEIDSEIDNLMSSEAYWNPEDPAHESTKNKVHQLFQHKQELM